MTSRHDFGPLIPAGPVEHLDEATDIPRSSRAEILTETLLQAGLRIGDGDDAVAAQIAATDWATVAVVASWIRRAAAGGDHRDPDPAP